MAFPPGRGSSFFPSVPMPPSGSSSSATARGIAPPEMNPSSPFLPFEGSQFDIFEWYPQYQSCVRYFLDHAQHSGPVQAVAAFTNIRLPFQKLHNPVTSYRHPVSPSAVSPPPSRATGKLPAAPHSQPNSFASLTPYLRRLVATGFDHPGVLHGFFGDDWAAGVGRLHEVERRNYLFAAKSQSWLEVMSHYDLPDDQNCPFLKPLQNVTEKEILNSEASWSEWLAMQDWMVGPRSPEVERDVPMTVKTEET